MCRHEMQFTKTIISIVTIVSTVVVLVVMLIVVGITK